MLGVLKSASLRAEQTKAGNALDHHSSEKQDRGFSISWTTQFWIILFIVNNKLCWTLDNVRVNCLPMLTGYVGEVCLTVKGTKPNR